MHANFFGCTFSFFKKLKKKSENRLPYGLSKRVLICWREFIMTTQTTLLATWKSIPLIAFLGLFFSTIQAEEYYLIPVEKLVPDYQPSSNAKPPLDLFPYANTEKGTKAWVCPTSKSASIEGQFSWQLAISSPRPLEQVTGTIYLPDPTRARLSKKSINLPTQAYAVNQTQFYRALEVYYARLQSINVNGQFWFRDRLSHALRMQGKSLQPTSLQAPNRQNRSDRMLDIFSGSQALEENLQLNRDLIAPQKYGVANVDVSGIEGITIKEFNFKELLQGSAPKLDSLGDIIPYDQHVVFLHSVNSVTEVLKETEDLFAPVFNALAFNTVDNAVIPHYLRQMNLDFEGISKQKIAGEIREIAITGSDPYSHLGTDMGIILELANESNAKLLADLVLFDSFKDKVKPIDGIPQSGWYATMDRKISIYLFYDNNRVWISNSSHQIRYLKKCHGGDVPPLTGLDEFQFFRQRYQLDGEETAFAFMSDAAIRRWCGPQWRITQSRRRRVATYLNLLQAKHLGECLAMDEKDSLALDASPAMSKKLGKLSLTRNGVHSAYYGTTAFMTPISELNIQKVTADEKRAYDRWRNGYQRNWSGAFDPIGVQLKIRNKEISADITVIPLILSSDYGIFRNGIAFAKDSGDRHTNSLFHLIFNLGSDFFWAPFFKNMVHAEIYLDNDPKLWKDFSNAADALRYFEKEIGRIPLALAFSFQDAKSMANFRSLVLSFFSDPESKPQDLLWQGIQYSKHGIKEAVSRAEDAHFYTLEVESKILFSVSEKIIKEAIDRLQKRKTDPDFQTVRPWDGRHLAIQTNANAFRAFEAIAIRHLQTEMRDATWRNFPILLEWKRFFPDEDPLEFHRRFWKQTFLCAGGGEIFWDESNNTPASTVFGSPAQPRPFTSTPSPLENIQQFDAGITFENDGLRGKIKLKRKK